jgi:nucleotide-binding universal stress UspA family protein
LHVAPPDPDFVGYGPGPSSVRDAVSRDLREAHRKLDALAADATNDGVIVRPLMIQGSAPETILEQAERLSVEYIVIGSHGHGAVHEILTGSVARRVLRQASVPVVVVP